MSDTDVDTDFDPTNFIIRQQRASTMYALGSLEDDPDKAARAVQLSNATGDKAPLIYGDLDNYEQQHKAALTGQLLRNNKFLREYIDADPMNAKLSNDGYASLDGISESVSRLGLSPTGKAFRAPEAIGKSIFEGAWEGFKKGFGDSPSGSWLTDEDLREHKLGSAIAATLAMPIEGIFRFGSGMLEGTKEAVKGGASTAYQAFGGSEQGAEQFSRELSSMVEQHMMGVSGVHAPHIPERAVQAQTAGTLFKQAQVEKARGIVLKATPWLDESKEPPRFLDPEIDKLKFEQNKIDMDNLDEAVKASQVDPTRERDPERFAGFIRQHTDASIGISGDAVARLYGDKEPTPDDAILGWSPGIAAELRVAAATGGDVRVPLADFLAKADPEVYKEIKDDIRVRPGGITKAEKELEAKAKEGLEPSFDEGEPKETIVGPAAKFEDKIYQGITHPVAAEKALKTIGKTIDDVDKVPGLEAEGFLTSTGRYVSREEAYKIAVDSEQITEGAKKYMHGRESLDAGDLGMAKHIKDAEERQKPKPAGGGSGYKPAEIIPEALPAVRATAGLEPMFSNGDRKLELKSRPHDPKIDAATGLTIEGKEIVPDHYNLLDENGKAAGYLDAIPMADGKRLFVSNVGGFEHKGFGPNSFGPALTRDLARQLKEAYPDAEEIGGFRISGAREKAGATGMTWIKFDELEGPQGWTHAEAMYNLLNATKVDVGRPGILHYSPEFQPHEAKLDAAIRDLLGKIAPGAEVFTPAHIEVPGRPDSFRGGFMWPHHKVNPWIVVALDSETFGSAVGIARHEAVHFLRQFGFFKEGEWDVLQQAAREQDWLKKFRIEERYPKLDMRGKLEEAIAEGYRTWARGEEVPSSLHPIFQRLKDLFDGLRAKVREILGREPTWDELFAKMDTGEVGAREPTGHAGGAFFEPKMSEGEAPQSPFGKGAIMPEENAKRYAKLIAERHAEDLAKATARAEAVQRKQQTAEWKENQKSVRAEVAERIVNQPDASVDLFVQENRVKFGEQYLTREQQAKLPRDYVSKSGVNPDDLSGRFGFGSGDAMIDRLGEYIEPRRQANMSAKDYVTRAIDLETERQMGIRYGSLEKSILDEVKDQALSETQTNLLHEEVLALGLKAGTKVSITKDQIKAWVKQEVASSPLRALDSDNFMTTAGKAGKAAELALLKGDFAGAFREKQRQFLAHEMAVQAKKIEDEVGKFEKVAGQLGKREQPSMDPAYVPYIHHILLQIGKPLKRTVQDLQASLDHYNKTLEEFTNEKEQYLREIPVADFLKGDNQIGSNTNFRKDFENLTVEEFRAVRDSLRALAANARAEQKIYKAGEAADLDLIKSEMIAQLKTFKEKFYDTKGGRWLLGIVPPKLATAIRSFGVAHLQMEALFNRWDRGDPRGVFTQYVMRDLAASANYEAALERKYSRALKELGSPKDLGKQVDNPIFKNPVSKAAGEEGQLMQFTRQNMLAVLLNAGNESNLVKFAKGYDLHREQVMDWLNTHATKEDWAWAQKMWDTFAEIKKESDTMYRSLTGGVEPQAIDIKPIQTPHGELPGGYYPVIYHPQFEGTSRKLMGGDALEGEGFHRATTPAGYTQKRTGYSAPMALDLDLMPVRMRQMLHDIAMRPAVINAGKIFYDKEVRTAIAKHYGIEYREMLIPYLKSVANSANSANQDSGSRIFINASEFIRQNMVSTLIGLNPGTIMKHGPTAAINSITEVGPINFFKAVRGLLSINDETGESNWRFAMDTSQELQRRHRNYAETLSGATQEMMPTSGYGTLRDNIIKFSATPVAISDLLSAVPTWMAKYETMMKDGAEHGDAVYEADRAVRRAHGSMATTNRPRVMRGPAVSWFASVYGFFSHILNRQFELMWRAGDTLDLVKQGEYKEAMSQVPRLTGMLFSYVLLPALIEEMVTPLASDDKESWGKKAAKGLAYTIAGSWIGIRDIASGMLRGQDPAVGLFSTTYKAVSDVARDMSNKPFTREHAGRVIQHGAILAGTLTGLMPAQIGKSARFAYGVATGTERPKGPWGWMVGTRFGTLEKHSKTFDEWQRHH